MILDAFLALYPRVPIVAIGNVADGLLGKLAAGRRRFKVRHPANGGATAFGTGLDAIAVELGTARPQRRRTVQRRRDGLCVTTLIID